MFFLNSQTTWRSTSTQLESRVISDHLLCQLCQKADLQFMGMNDSNRHQSRRLQINDERQLSAHRDTRSKKAGDNLRPSSDTDSAREVAGSRHAWGLEFDWNDRLE
jgi:hypothetical protein